jgi:hypothetical protein
MLSPCSKVVMHQITQYLKQGRCEKLNPLTRILLFLESEDPIWRSPHIHVIIPYKDPFIRSVLRFRFTCQEESRTHTKPSNKSICKHSDGLRTLNSSISAHLRLVTVSVQCLKADSSCVKTSYRRAGNGNGLPAALTVHNYKRRS